MTIRFDAGVNKPSLRPETMPISSPHYVDAARRLLAHESAGKAEERAVAARRVYDTLLSSLAPIIGAAGVRALFARSVRLSLTEFPCLEAVLHVEAPDGDHGQRLVECLRKLDAEAALEVATGLYAALLGLMAKFIGERMMWHLVARAFPAVDMSGLKEKVG
jgi:hypothetical protein